MPSAHRRDREAELRQQIDQRPARAADAICEALVHLDNHTCPSPPEQWLHDGLLLYLPGWADPLARLEQLWRRAWEEGHRAGVAHAQQDRPDETSLRPTEPGRTEGPC